jgi:hypothetical protein
MSGTQDERLHSRRRDGGRATALGVGAAVIAAAVATVPLAGAKPSAPPFLAVVLLGGLFLLAENSGVLLPTRASASPSLMVALTAITAFSAYGPVPAISGSLLVGLIGGFPVAEWRRREFRVVAINCGQYGLAAAAAAGVFAILSPTGQFAGVIVGVLATMMFSAVNVGVVMPLMSARHQLTLRQLWVDVVPLIPNFAAFGLLGVLLGQLYTSLGEFVLPLVLVPGVIARQTFRAHLELHEAHEAALQVFVRAIEAKDPYTAGHCERVARFARYIGEELELSPTQLDHLRYAAYLHDVGKLAVPSSLLNKPGRLTADEYEQVRRHNDVAIAILSKIDFLRSTIPVASDQHAHFHEDPTRADPSALEAQAVAVADAFDAMTSTRSYRRALTHDVAVQELHDNAGTQFNPACVDALVRALAARRERYGLGFETDAHEFPVEPPTAGVGSAGIDYHDRRAAT